MKSYAFILFTFFTTLLTAQVTYLQCGALFDAEKKKFLGPHTILIEGNQITAVKKVIKTLPIPKTYLLI